MYLPLNVGMMLLWRSELLSKDPRKFFGQLLTSSLRSSAFITVFASVAWLPPCYIQRLTGKNWAGSYLLNGFLSGATVVMEYPKSRRLELALYCFPRAVESAWNLLVLKKFVRPIIETWQTALFSKCHKTKEHCRSR
eukprot:Partr_v1_DN28734_c5_g1_i5_m61741